MVNAVTYVGIDYRASSCLIKTTNIGRPDGRA